MSAKPSVGERLDERLQAHRGAAFRWLSRNYDELEPRLRHRPAWRVLSEMAREAGVVAAPDTLRKAWPLVKALKAKRQLAKPPIPAFEIKPPDDDDEPLRDVLGNPI